MSCKGENIRRNWEYGWEEPNENWIWAVTTEEQKDIAVRMQDAFHKTRVTIGSFLVHLAKNIGLNTDEVYIICKKTNIGVELTANELDMFKKFMIEHSLRWAIVNKEKIVIDASDCDAIGEGIDEWIEKLTE